MKAAKGQLNDERNISRMVRLIQAALITRCHGQPRVRISNNFPSLEAQNDNDEKSDVKEEHGHDQGSNDKNEERKNDKGKAGDELGDDEQDLEDDENEDEDEGNVDDDDEAIKVNKVIPGKKKHFSGRPRLSNNS